MLKHRGFKVGEVCRLKSSPNYGYVLIQSFNDNVSPKRVWCHHSSDLNFSFCFVREFYQRDLLKDKERG
jgi:hypothetical protein